MLGTVSFIFFWKKKKVLCIDVDIYTGRNYLQENILVVKVSCEWRLQHLLDRSSVVPGSSVCGAQVLNASSLLLPISFQLLMTRNTLAPSVGFSAW